ncbi:MAG TPA: ATP-binding cassette domain-containing protein, partial [Candidatus Limnocylindria bacterium]|nr:ATP-binding cassette domain-containing protein [Candidatus Limnocylindria bacterium]
MSKASPSTPTSPSVAISVRDLWMSFPNTRSAEMIHVLERINLDVKHGEFVCIVGPSGCGKSTLLNIVGGFLHQSRGEAIV